MPKNVIDFGDQVPLGKAKIEFKQDPAHPGLMTMGISGTGFMAVYQIAISYDGRMLQVVPMMGIGVAPPPYPKPSMLAWILSDQHGMWGRTCPGCSSYFRTNHQVGTTFCPYCSGSEDSLAFVTQAQRQYLAAWCTALTKAQQEKVDVTVDLESVTDSNPEWHYSEEKQQFHFECVHCKTRVDVLGDYGWCPQCGRSNAATLFVEKLKVLEERFEKADKDIQDRNQRADEWNSLTSALLSEYESVGNHLKKRLELIPATQSRKAALQNLSFQRLFEMSDSLQQWYGIDVFRGISEEDKPFLTLMLQRRHIIIHNGSRADADYLARSGDTQAKLNERIRVRSQQVRRLVALVRAIGVNTIEGVEGIS